MHGRNALSSLAPAHRQVCQRPTRARSPLAVVSARPGDHQTCHSFLATIFRGISPVEFHAAIEDPSHGLGDRLVVKGGHEILGHALVRHQTVRLGQALVPTGKLHSLATAPSLRHQGFGTLLVRRAERRMMEAGDVLALLSTSIPGYFAQLGWTPCGRNKVYRVSVREVLSVLASKGLHPRISHALDIRPLRRMEVDQVAQVYRAAVARQHGSLERSEAHWHWLVNRGAYDTFLVAIDTRGARRSGQGEKRIVGYAVLVGNHVVELFTLPDHSRAAVELLSRACADAMECGVDSLRIHLTPRDGVTRVLRAAAATRQDTHSGKGEVLMAKVLRPELMLRHLRHDLRDRAIEAHLPIPLDFGLAADRQKFRLSIDPGGADGAGGSLGVASGTIGRSYLRTSPSRLTQLLLGQVKWKQPKEMEFSSQLAEQAARVLFPRQAFWHPPFDDLPARGQL